MAIVILLLLGFVAFLAVGAALGFRVFVRQRAILARLDRVELALRDRDAPPLQEGAALPVAAPAEPAVTEEPAAAPSEPEAAPAFEPVPPPRRPLLEQRLASRWMVWLGGATIALAVVFFVNYAIEHAWLSPAVRVMLGCLLGAALIALGNLARAAAVREISRRVSAVTDVEAAKVENFVPAALTGSGLFALYASVEVAYAVYGLIGDVVAFVALAAVGLLGMALALRHGWLVAALGLIGAYLAPALISSREPSAAVLFTYLGGVTWFCLWLLSSRQWPVLAAATWLAAFGWAFAWMGAAWHAGDELVLGPYLLAVGLLSALFPPRLGPSAAPPWWPGREARADDPPAGSLIGLTGSAALTLVLLVASGHSPAAVLVSAACVGLAFLLQDRRLVDERLAVVSGALVVAALLTWPDAAPAGSDGPFAGPVPDVTGFARLLAADPRLVWSALGLSALVWIACVRALPASRDPALVAGAAAAVPLLALLVLYGRLGRFETSAAWAGIALALALVNLWAAATAAARRTALGDAPLSAFAAAVTAAVALAFACLLRDAWPPVALCAEVLALAWIWSRLRVDGLRAIAVIVAAAAVCLLLVRIGAVGEGGTAARVARVLYGYGLPCALLAAAVRIFAPPPDRRSGIAADAVVTGLGVLTGSLAIRQLGLGHLAEAALHSLWWLRAGLALLREAPAHRRALFVAGNLLVAAAIVLLGLGCALAFNPILAPVPVGRLPLVNLLGLAYLVPALLLAFGAAAPLRLVPRLRALMAPAAGVLLFIYLTLETLRLFQGSRLDLHGTGEGALYAISIVWLGYALALLAGAFRFDLPRLRPAALAVLAATVLKVFLLDFAWLSGLTRVASFLVLGLVLVGVGEAYRRFFRPAPD